jgi:hypothetical protein
MSTKPTEPELAATPDVVVENLRSAADRRSNAIFDRPASEGELAAQVVADGALDSKLLGLLGFFAAAGSILATMIPMDNKPKLKPAPLPPPSGIPGGEIPTGLRGSWGLQELRTLLRRLLHRS